MKMEMRQQEGGLNRIRPMLHTKQHNQAAQLSIVLAGNLMSRAVLKRWIVDQRHFRPNAIDTKSGKLAHHITPQRPVLLMLLQCN